jgi:polyisoprenoid-binding protein YceI
MQSPPKIMKPIKSLKLISTVVPVLLLLACSDPSANVPAASVTTNTTAATAPSASISAATQLYAISPENSKIEFTGSKVTGKHDGGFKDFSGDVQVADGSIKSAKVTIKTASLFSDNDRLTGHLKSADFFDAEKYPTAVFETTAISGTGSEANVTGNLTLHGITKQISFPAKIEVKDDVATVNAEFSINRFDFNMKYPGKADDLIRDNVVLRLDVKATPKQA